MLLGFVGLVEVEEFSGEELNGGCFYTLRFVVEEVKSSIVQKIFAYFLNRIFFRRLDVKTKKFGVVCTYILQIHKYTYISLSNNNERKKLYTTKRFLIVLLRFSEKLNTFPRGSLIFPTNFHIIIVTYAAAAAATYVYQDMYIHIY